MRQRRIPIILLFCFCLLVSCSSIFAQQPPQANEKELGIELYRKGNFSEAVKALKEAVKKQRGRFRRLALSRLVIASRRQD